MSVVIEKQLAPELVLAFLEKVPRDQLTYGDHRRFKDAELRMYNANRISRMGDPDILICHYHENRLDALMAMQYLGFDSDYLELKSYRVTDLLFVADGEPEMVLPELWQTYHEVVRDLRIEYVVGTVNMNNSMNALLFNSFMAHDFYYINTLVTFAIARGEYEAVHHQQPKTREVIVRKSLPMDRDRLMEIAGTSYKIDRFHLDPNLDKGKCDRMYAESAENSLLKGRADVIFVSEKHHEVTGYYSGRKHVIEELGVTFGDAIISAVDESHRQDGAFSLMNESLLAWFSEECDVSEMGTYINNIPVHRTWIKNGLPLIRGVHQLASYRKWI